MPRHLLEIDDLTAAEVARVLDLAVAVDVPRVLDGQGMALVFEKPSARTRSSMEMAVVQLGGHPVYVQGSEVGLDQRESVEDVTHTLACYHSAIGARVFAHDTVERMASVDAVPVVNLLSDAAHPVQALADLLTIRQMFGRLEGIRIAYVGDANNVARSLALGAGLVGAEMVVAAPGGYEFGALDLDRIRATGLNLHVTDRPAEAAAGAHVVYTDVWTSMGQEDQADARRRAFEGFQVDDALMAVADPDGIFLHCLPAHRGEEVSGSVVSSDRSRVWSQATNRMHAARGLLAWLLSEAR